jgi:CRP-like cAMP-binding protein
MDAQESVGSHLARLIPNLAPSTMDGLAAAARQQAFKRSDVLHARGMQLPPFILLEGHLLHRRVVETGQVRAALIAGPGFLGGLRSISDPSSDALYELAALSDGVWATWDPHVMREFALQDANLAVGLLDLAAAYAVVLNVRLDERSFETARQRMAAILTRYGEEMFDTAHPIARRDDLAAMIGTSRVLMYRTLRNLETEGLVKRHRGGGISIVNRKALARLVEVAAPPGAPAL